MARNKVIIKTQYIDITKKDSFTYIMTLNDNIKKKEKTKLLKFFDINNLIFYKTNAQFNSYNNHRYIITNNYNHNVNLFCEINSKIIFTTFKIYLN